MIENAHVAGNDFVFKNGARWNIDSIAMIRNYNNGALCLKFIEIRLNSIRVR